MAYGAADEEEKDLFRQLVARNARNMNFESWQVIFTDEARLEETVESEAAKWQKS